jgi:ABC-2 type transport system ATP-binding protein
VTPDIITENLGLRFGSRWALRGITVELGPGLTALAGPTGAGKTSLLRLILGLLAPSEGRVLLLGSNPQLQPATRVHAGYLPQDFKATALMRLNDYLESLALLSGVPPREVNRLVIRALEAVELTGKERQLLPALATSARWRVGIAQALVHGPHLLLLDEPAAGLDPRERRQLQGVLLALAAQQPVLLATGRFDGIATEAARVWFLHEGRLAWAGSSGEATAQLRGRMRAGVLPEGESPEGLVISKEPAFDGITWRVLGDDPRLDLVEPTLADAYFVQAGRPETGA